MPRLRVNSGRVGECRQLGDLRVGDVDVDREVEDLADEAGGEHDVSLEEKAAADDESSGPAAGISQDPVDLAALLVGLRAPDRRLLLDVDLGRGAVLALVQPESAGARNEAGEALGAGDEVAEVELVRRDVP